MNQEQENWTDFVLSKKEIESCRHKSEKRWYRFLCILNAIIIIGVIGCMVALLPKKVDEFKQNVSKYAEEIGTTLDEATGNTKEGESGKQEKSKKKAEKNEDKGQDEVSFSEEEDSIFSYCIIAVIAFIIFPLALNFMYQQYRTMSIRITPKNFPDIYERVELYAKRLGMKKAPEAYIIQQNGILNAFSAFIIRKQYIEIYADIFEIAYREHKDLDSISFVIAHEMAHIHYKHATFGYNFKMLFSSAIPILGSTASRAREYSCDRLAQKLTGNDGIEAMFSLMAGKHLYKMVDKEDYLEYAKSVKGIFVWAANLVADHPIMTKRIVALEKGEGSGKLY
ncbi:MAG: M48 family metallopeptidase [Lachnospiraceae bacterium]|nr:M48 family metallopeptidase [Lachnospiraceae bacterium]